MVEWSPPNQEDLLWWSDLSNLLQGVSLEEVRSELLFWSDASEQRWGTYLHGQFVSALWSPAERSLSINLRELRTICLGLHLFRGLVVGSLLTIALLFLTSGNRGRRSPQRSVPKPNSPSLGGGVGDHFGSPVHYGVPECGRRLVELSPSGPGVRMDPLPGCCRLTPDSEAGCGGPLRHCHELSHTGLFLTTRQSNVGRH